MEKEREVRLLPLRKHDQGENKESFLSSFLKENITLEKLINYIIKYLDEPGVIDFLTNKLYTFSDKDLDFYIPELWYFIKTKP